MHDDICVAHLHDEEVRHSRHVIPLCKVLDLLCFHLHHDDALCAQCCVFVSGATIHSGHIT